MGLNLFKRSRATADVPPAETRGHVTIESSGDVSISDVLNGEALSESVTMREAMSLPGVWAAINFLSSAMAGLPVEVFERTAEAGGDPKVEGGVADVLGSAINDTTTSFNWRETFFSQVFGPGRAYTYIERDREGNAINLFPMEYDRTTVRKRNGRIYYDYAEAGQQLKTYKAADVIDIAFLMKPDGVQCYNPVKTCAAAIRQGLNANRYALTVFGKNGIPPYVLKGPFQAGKEMLRAAADMMRTARRSAEEGKPILPIPSGMDLVRLGDDPEKMQLTPVQVFAVGQVARIYQLPPVFLQDLSKANYSNMEHQDLHLVKHTLRRWVKKFEQELTLKIFGRGSKFYIKLNIDAIVRGDLKTRIEALAKAVQSGLMTLNEARALDNRAPIDGGDILLVQGAMVPLEMAGKAFARNPLPEEGGGETDDQQK